MPSHDAASGYRIVNEASEIIALLHVAAAASDKHDEECGCAGEACKLGDALAKLDAVQGRTRV